MHTLYTGTTESGKTTLARKIARELARKGQKIVVYDPVGTNTKGGGWPESAVLFSEKEKFLQYVERDDVIHCHVFIDEADEIFSIGQKENHWLLKRGRHFGMYCHVITQRPNLVAPTVRGQCTRFYLFRLSHDDAQAVAKDAGHEWPLDEKPMEQGDFFALYSASPEFERHNVFNLTKGTKP